MGTKINPTFLLKGLDVNKLLADYQAGVFSRNVSTKSQIKISSNITILAPVYGTTNKSPIFCIKDRNNCSVIIATTGHVDFDVFTRTGGQLQNGGRCDACKKDFEHAAVGYPLGYQESTVLTNSDSNIQNARYRIIYTFWVEGTYCGFECAYEDLEKITEKSSNYRDSTVRDSGRMLQMLYKLMYPNNPPLRPKQNPRLLNVHGNRGSLSEDQLDDKRHIYIRTDRIVMMPAKVEYIQQHFQHSVISIDQPREVQTTNIY